MNIQKAMVVLALVCVSAISWASPIVVDQNGRFVGFYQGLGIAGLEVAVSNTGYRFGFQRSTGKIAPTPDLGTNFWSVFFALPDCAGQAYVEAANRVPGFIAIPDFEFQPSAPPPVYYLPQALPAPIAIQRKSTFNYGGAPPLTLSCYNDATPTTLDSYPIEPNNPNETGIPNEGFVPPLRVISSWLFRDGFESPLTGVFGLGSGIKGKKLAWRGFERYA